MPIQAVGSHLVFLKMNFNLLVDFHASHPVFLTSLPAVLPTRVGGLTKPKRRYFSAKIVAVKFRGARYIVGYMAWGM